MSTVRSETIVCQASAIQEQFWVLNQLHPESPAYNIPLLFRIKGRLNRACLERSINEVIRRHAILRTRFVMDKGTLCQVIEPEMAVALEVECPGEPEGRSGAVDVVRLVSDAVRRPFDLSELPLLRCRLWRLPDGDHLFLLVMHHIITDLRSKDLFTAELSTLYEAFGAEKKAVLPPLPPPYSDYAAWQRAWLAGDECRSMVSYWRDRLEGQPGLLDFPMEKKRPAVLSYPGEGMCFQLDARLTEGLKRFSRKNSVSVFLPLLAAYVVLLFRYSGQNRLTIGVPLTNRRQAKFRETLGCFVNIVPLALAFDGEATFLELLGHVRRAMLGAHRNQEVPFHRLTTALGAKKNPGHNPLFQAGFTFAPPSALPLEGLDVEPLPLHNGGAQLEMFFTLWEAEGEIRGHFEYNTDLFDGVMMRRVAANYTTLLQEVLHDCERPVSSIPLMSAKERERLCVEWNRTAVSLSRAPGIHRMVEAQVVRTPQAPAARFEGTTLSYDELNRRANRLAHFLLAVGVKRDEPVGIYLERSLDMLVALLGVMKAGAAYLPLDPAFPEERLLYMLTHSGTRVVLSQESLEGALPGSKARWVFLDADGERIAREREENPAVEVSPDNLAYVIYTSGSTGRPKGVKVPHGAAVNFLASMAKRPGLDPSDVLLAVTTLSFDIAVLELFLPLTVGARLVIATRETAADGALLLGALSREGVTVLQATPVTWRFLLEAGWRGGGHFKVLCGGEPMAGDLAAMLVETGASVWNMYGPTETTVWSTCGRVTAGHGPISVGRPIDNTRIYILGKGMEPVPTGVTGTLFIGGAGVTLGYLGQPELTGERFVDDPFVEDPRAKLYDTGDLARYRGDGTIEVLGRSDFQLKVNGFRIEAGEVESVLGRHPLVTQAIVSVHEFEPGDARLVAYYTRKSSRKGFARELQAFLSGTLPDYMIPSLFVPLEEMPLTPNGKVDRKRLPAPTVMRPESGPAYQPPKRDLEVLLSGIWAHVLKLDAVGVHDSFFDMGGNSLLGIRAVGEVGAALGQEIPVVKLFQYPTIALFANFLSGETLPGGGGKSLHDRAKLKKQSRARRRTPS